MRTINPFHDEAENLAREFQRLATERAKEFCADEDSIDSEEDTH